MATSGIPTAKLTQHHSDDGGQSIVQLTWHREAAGRVVVVAVGQSIPQPADLNGVRRSDRLAGQRERSAPGYILVLRLEDKGRQTCVGPPKVRKRRNCQVSDAGITHRNWPSTSRMIGWDSTSLVPMVSLQRYAPASVCCTWMMLQNTRTLVSPQPSPCFLLWGLHLPHLSASPDLRQVSYDPVCERLEVLDGHSYVPRQVLAVLHPEDGGLQPVVGDVDGAVEFSFMALGQLHGPYGGFKSQLAELLRGQVGQWNVDWYHNRLGRMIGWTPWRLTCVLEIYLQKNLFLFDSFHWLVSFNFKLNSKVRSKASRKAESWKQKSLHSKYFHHLL